jgi:hypothetical protein
MSIIKRHNLALAISLACLAGVSSQRAYAIDVPPTGNYWFFTPFGSQLDSDSSGSHNPGGSNIYDIEIKSNKILNFDVYLSTDFTEPTINSIVTASISDGTFAFSYDSNEWNPTGDIFADVAFGCTKPNDTGLGSYNFSCNGLGPASINVMNGLAPNFVQPIKLFTITGVTKNPGLSPHDGDADFSFTFQEINAISVTTPSVNPITLTTELGTFQDVELQQKVPGPLPLLGVGAAFGYSRKLRKRIKTSKTSEVMSAIG